jgi:glycosyltransferase involved in cell wall biosynthesis
MKIDYEKYYENKNNKNTLQISLIALINNKEDNNIENIKRLINNIRNQTLKDIELIIMTDDNELNYQNITSKDINIKIFKYKNNVGKLKKRLDGIYNSKGKYILFIDADDYFTSKDVLEKIYNQAIKDNIDILEFTSFHTLNCFASNPVYPPQLFDLMYFEKDIYLQMKQYHLVGKIISNKLLIYTLNTINMTYIEENINLFDECMILLMIFQRASSFELLKIRATYKTKRNSNSNNFLFYEEGSLKDFLFYCKFLIQYTDDNVPEKRMSAKIFIMYLIDKNYIIPHKYLKLLNDVINLYLDCDKIGENEINRIKEYQNRNRIKK